MGFQSRERHKNEILIILPRKKWERVKKWSEGGGGKELWNKKWRRVEGGGGKGNACQYSASGAFIANSARVVDRVFLYFYPGRPACFRQNSTTTFTPFQRINLNSLMTCSRLANCSKLSFKVALTNSTFIARAFACDSRTSFLQQ